MSDEGANLTVVENGLQAVRMFQEKPEGYFDAILMDIMMPVIDGLTATNSIRSLNHPDAKKIPIIAMTANAFKKDKEKCLAADERSPAKAHRNRKCKKSFMRTDKTIIYNQRTRFFQRHFSFPPKLYPYLCPSSQNATALAAATFNESTPWDIGIFTV